jgi:hypothetical protein
LHQFRLIKNRVKGKEEEEEGKGKGIVDGDGGRRYTATQTGAGRPDRMFAMGGGQTERNSWNSGRTVSPNKIFCSRRSPSECAFRCCKRTRAAEVMDE